MNAIRLTRFDRAGVWDAYDVQPPTAHAAHVRAVELAEDRPDKGVHVSGEGDDDVDDDVRDEVETGATRGYRIAALPIDQCAAQAITWAQLDLQSARACIRESHAVHSSDPDALPSWWRDAAANDLRRALYWRRRADQFAAAAAVFVAAARKAWVPA